MAITFSGPLIIGQSALYPFTSFRFTTAGVSGSTGPLGTTILAAYTGSSSGSYFSNSTYFTTGSFQGYQIWTVPQTATYEIEVAGAASGLNNYPTLTAGRYTSGAIIKGRIELIKGQKFVMVVGQRSLNATTAATGFNGIGGGGGSFFVLSGSNVPYLIAGGGGGMGAYSNDPLGGAVLRSGSLAGNGSTSTTGSLSFRNAPGGTGGLGGRSHINTASAVSTNGYDGGAGAGFLGNGYRGDGTLTMTALANHGAGGYSFLSGSVGGFAASSYTPNQATQGGFGGGGGGSPIAGGGGGGYSGGGGSYANNTPVSDGGGGGGSYIISNISVISTSDGNYDGLSTFSGSSITNLNNYNSGSGYIQITKL